MTETTLPPCPECRSPYSYEAGALLACPECGHEWSPGAAAEAGAEVRDSLGNRLADGDTVTVIKVGTKVRGIRLVPGDHDIDCKIPGIGQIGLKSEFVKKVAD